MSGCVTKASYCPSSRNTEERGIIWRLPAYNTVHNILTNPIHAGAYAFGRTTSKVSVEEGRKRVRRGVRRPVAEWDVLLKDQHEGYITWEQFERNQRVIADNATGKGSATVKALEAQATETSAAQRQLELALQRARYEAAHARRQYDAVDPANRLVAGELERRWDEALQAMHRIEGEIAAIVARKPAPLGER